MPYSQEFGELVKKHMGGRDYRQVAPQVGVHYATLYDWARGNAPARPDAIQRFAQVLRLDEDEILRLLEAGRLVEPRDNPRTAIRTALDHADELEYDPDLEDADIFGLLGQVDEADREELERVIRAVRSEQRRRRERGD